MTPNSVTRSDFLAALEPLWNLLDVDPLTVRGPVVIDGDRISFAQAFPAAALPLAPSEQVGNEWSEHAAATSVTIKPDPVDVAALHGQLRRIERAIREEYRKDRDSTKRGAGNAARKARRS